MGADDQDSPLSIASNIIGILTFVIAVAAAVYVRFTYLRNGDDEYFRVKTSLSWYKTESQWLADLLVAIDGRHESFHAYQPESHMYAFVMDDLLNLERRLLEIVSDVEARADVDELGQDWALVPRSWRRGRTSVVVAWLSVRSKALELVRQREALTTRVQFLQMSMVASRLRNLETRLKWREMKMDESSRKAEGFMDEQKGEVQRLDDIVQLMRREKMA